MLASNEIVLTVLIVMGGIACVAGGAVILGYYIQHIRVTKTYLHTRDIEAWSKSIKRISIRTALAVLVFTFIATEACIFAFMTEAEPLRTPAMLRNGVILGIVISLLLASLVLAHARWQDALKNLARLLRGKQ